MLIVRGLKKFKAKFNFKLKRVYSPIRMIFWFCILTEIHQTNFWSCFLELFKVHPVHFQRAIFTKECQAWRENFLLVLTPETIDPTQSMAHLFRNVETFPLMSIIQLNSINHLYCKWGHWLEYSNKSHSTRISDYLIEKKDKVFPALHRWLFLQYFSPNDHSSE